MQLRERLAAICKTHLLSDQGEATVPEPYIPFIPEIPERWNGILLLAEAQNHGNARYLAWLRNECPDRIQRLYVYHYDLDIGVQPWDDGSLKLAVESALGVKAQETAISNAVLWSQTHDRRNKNLGVPLIASSVAVWKEMFRELGSDLKKIITVGNTARDIVDTCDLETNRIHWRHPAPNAMSKISSMFSADDLLSRYPEVARVDQAHPDWATSYRQNKIFFACHAVSTVRRSNQVMHAIGAAAPQHDGECRT
jgi:hypothetical protein